MLDWLRALRRKEPAYRWQTWQKTVPAESLQQTYDGHGWGEPAGQWRQRNHVALAARIGDLARQRRAPVTVLDVACFTGDYFGRLVDTGSLQDCRYVGTDVTPSYVVTAARRWRTYERARFVCGSALDLPHRDAEFDIVFNTGMLIHMDNVERCLAEMARVTRSYLLVETTIRPGLARDFVHQGGCGPDFIDRVYRIQYIRDAIAAVATPLAEISVPYKDSRQYESVLFEATRSA